MNHIGDIKLYSLEYAEDPMSNILLPDHGSYGEYHRDVLEALFAAIPHWLGIEIVELHCNRSSNGCDAAFTWYHSNLGRTCTTKYWGDGVYYLTGILEDNTVVQLAFDTHCMRQQDIKDLGNIMCDELMEIMNNEEEYEHIKDTSCYGTSVKRGRRLPEKLTKKQLLLERSDLVEKRKMLFEKLDNASGRGIAFWQNAIKRCEDELRENVELLEQV